MSEELQPDPGITMDHAVRDWSGSRPLLRRDVRFHYQSDHERPVYVVEDLTNRRYLQVGLPEYQFIRGLDGTKTAAQLIAENARRNEDDALSETDAIATLRWLLDQQLLEPDTSDQSNRRFNVAESAPKKPSKGLMSLLFHRFPLGNPDRIMGGAARLLGWTLSRPAMFFWCVLVGYGLYLALSQWRMLAYAGGNAVLPSNWFFLLAVFVVLKLIHELWHGIATKRFGGVVPEWGVQLIAFVTPLTYVDASSSWCFPSRWQRWVVAAAGMYIELAIAAVAIIVWTQTSAGFINSIAANVVVAASTITLLFNANPLMRFDGYYMLCDSTGIKNLGTKGTQMLNWLGRRLVMGVKRLPLPTGTRTQPILIGTYGVAAGFWRVILTTSILVMVGSLFQGIGLIFASVAAVSIVLMGIWKFGKYLLSREPGLSLATAAFRVSALLVGVGATMMLVKVQPAPTAPAVVKFPETAVIRAKSPGFVESILVVDGDRVEAGQVLLRLQNDDSKRLLKKIQIESSRVELQSRLSFQKDEFAMHQAELQKLLGLREHETAQAEKVASLEICSPIDGVVTANHLHRLRDRYLTTGMEIATVVPTRRPLVVISASQESLHTLSAANPEARLRLHGRSEELSAMVHRVESRATTGLPHPVLAASNGGPLPIRQSLEKRSQRMRGLATELYEQESMAHFGGIDRSKASTSPQELMRPRFAAYAELSESDSETAPLREGEWGFVRLTGVRDTRLGVWLFHRIYDGVSRALRAGAKGGAV